MSTLALVIAVPVAIAASLGAFFGVAWLLEHTSAFVGDCALVAFLVMLASQLLSGTYLVSFACFAIAGVVYLNRRHDDTARRYEKIRKEDQ